jgi:hypothetical protein
METTMTETKPAHNDFDWDMSKEEFAGLLTGTVADITDPQLLQFAEETLADGITIGFMKLDPDANADLINDAEQTIEARIQTLAAVPNLILAGKQQEFIAAARRAVLFAGAQAVTIIRAYAGLPPIPPGNTATS